jgi:hypothetical protein
LPILLSVGRERLSQKKSGLKANGDASNMGLHPLVPWVVFVVLVRTCLEKAKLQGGK